jgi:hypothetical protein
MSSHHQQQPNDNDNTIVAFPQLHRGKNSTDSLSQFSLGSKASKCNEPGDGCDEPRISNIHSVDSLLVDQQQSQPTDTRPEQQQQQRPYDPDDASAGTWGSDSSDYSSSFNDDDDETFGLNGDQTSTPQTNDVVAAKSAWPVFDGVPLSSTNSNKGASNKNIHVAVDVPTTTAATTSKWGKSVRPHTTLSHTTTMRTNDASSPNHSELQGSAHSILNIKQPSGAVTQDAIADAQKRFFATLGGINGGGGGGGGDILGANVLAVRRLCMLQFMRVVVVNV